MEEGNSSQNNERQKRQEKSIARLVAYGATGIGLAYFVFFTIRGHGIGNPDAWGQFGDFFGGVMNPIVGIVTVVLVVQTLHATRAEADLTRREMEAQTRLFSAQLERYDNEKEMAELLKRLDGALAAWNKATEQEYHSLQTLLLKGKTIGVLSSTFGKIFSLSSIESQIEAAKRNQFIWPSAQGYWVSLGEDLANLLREIAQYCEDYDRKAESRLVTDFYRRRVNKGLRALSAAGMVRPTDYESLKVGRLHFADT